MFVQSCPSLTLVELLLNSNLLQSSADNTRFVHFSEKLLSRAYYVMDVRSLSGLSKEDLLWPLSNTMADTHWYKVGRLLCVFPC